MKKLSKKKVFFYSALIFLFLVLCIFLGAIIWTQTNSGYQSLTQWVKDKPYSSWQVKLYYGLYKKYPPYETVVLKEENTVVNKKYSEPSYQEEQISTSISAAIDKNLYRSGEKIKLNLAVESEKNMDDANLYIYGIKDSHNEYSTYENKKINLKEGNNNFEYSIELPYCNSCSGVKEGDYPIYIKIINDQTLIGQQEVKTSLRQ